MQVRSRQLHLDGLRGLAISAVVVWHSVSSPLGYEQLSPEGRFPVGPLAFAWAGVDVFFALSGYLITDILLRAKGASNYFAVFLLRRACRLLPLYFLILASYFVARHSWADDPILGRYLQNAGVPDWTLVLGLQNWWMGAKNSFGPGWLAVTWSLAVEWQFYLIWACVIRIVPRRTLWFLVLAGLLVSPVLRGLLPVIFGYVTLVGRADAFLGGALVALLLQEPLVHRTLQKQLVLLRGLVGLGLLGWLVMLWHPQAFGAVLPWYGTFTLSWIAWTTAGLILCLNLAEEHWFTRLIRMPPWADLGTISYGVYLLHQPVRFLCFRFLLQCEPKLKSWPDAWVTLLAVSACVLGSLLLYATLERGFIALGRRSQFRFPRCE